MRKAAALIGVLLLCLAPLACTHQFDNSVSDREIETWAQAHPTYADLALGCKERQSRSCCMESVYAMEGKNATLLNGTCPEGAQANGFLCIDGYSWCAKTN
jgi:hypothetical protein